MVVCFGLVGFCVWSDGLGVLSKLGCLLGVGVNVGIWVLV